MSDLPCVAGLRQVVERVVTALPTRRLPRPLGVVLGAAAVLLGAFLAVKPFSSLAVLVIVLVLALVVSGLVDLVGAGPERTGPWAVARAVTQLAAAAALLLWPGPGLKVVTGVVAVSLLVNGSVAVAEGVRVAGTSRWSRWFEGSALLLLGGLSLRWPDVAVLAIAIGFGVRMVILGIRLCVASWRGAPAALRPVHTGHPARGWGRLSWSVVAVTGAVALALLSVVIHRDTAVPDAFYASPDSVPSAPGRLVRSEPFTRDIPAGARAWRILYTTRDDSGSAALASAIVVTPRHHPGPTPLVAWAHGTTGWATNCAPSLLQHPFEAGAMFSLDRVVEHGWTMVATDYTGLGTDGSHPYLIGRGEGRSVLDSIRAAHELRQLSLTSETVVWGHSQGGHAALWTGILAPTYAPELTISGIAALAPASNLAALVDVVGSIRGGSLFAAYVAQAYTDTYPDVSYAGYIRPGARVIVREMAARCLADKGTLVSVASSLLLDKPIWHREPTTGAFGRRLAQNTPTGPIAAPLLVAQGDADGLVSPAAQAGYVAARCAAGYPVDFRTYAGRGHVELVEGDSPAIPDLLDWTAARFAGAPPADTCGTP